MKENPGDVILRKIMERMESVSNKLAEQYGGVKPFDRQMPPPSSIRNVLKSYSDLLAKKSSRYMGG